MRWKQDKWLWAAIIVGVILRVLPLALWPNDICVRDECTYIRLALKMADGDGMVPTSGWLWAPAYPSLMALHKLLFDYASSVKGLQIVAAAVSTVLVYVLARRAFSDDTDKGRRPARIAAWLYALSPHLIFFAGRLWSEVLYSTVLMGALLVMIAARQPQVRRALGVGAAVGVFVGACMLFRGVATYMLPIFALGLLWRRWGQRRAWLQAGLLFVAAAGTVAPYSVYVSSKFHATVITDRTLGQMMWLGNNDFEPLTFDYGDGQLSKRAFNRYKDRGRPPCADRHEAMERDSCSTQEGIDWIRAHPGEFVRRMPLRVAQMLNPHSLLTRHLRWGRFKGMPQWLDEVIILWGALASMLAMWAGALGLIARGKGGQGLTIGGILVYHVAAISVLAGLTRYRVPLEPLLMVYAAGLLADPRATLRALRGWRLAVAVVVMAALIPLVLWFLPAGWFWWRTW